MSTTNQKLKSEKNPEIRLQIITKAIDDGLGLLNIKSEDLDLIHEKLGPNQAFQASLRAKNVNLIRKCLVALPDLGAADGSRTYAYSRLGEEDKAIEMLVREYQYYLIDSIPSPMIHGAWGLHLIRCFTLLGVDAWERYLWAVLDYSFTGFSKFHFVLEAAPAEKKNLEMKKKMLRYINRSYRTWNVKKMEERDAKNREAAGDPKPLLEQFLEPGADFRALTMSLQPTMTDFECTFIGESSVHIKAAYDSFWEKPDLIRPDRGQTELKMQVLFTEDMKALSENEKHKWHRVVKFLMPKRELVSFRFRAPGDRFGTFYDGLIFSGERWVWMPELYKIGRDFFQNNTL